MAASVVSQESRIVWEPPPAKPLDETVWQAWVAENRAQDRKDIAARVQAAKWVSIVALLGAGGPWLHSTPYDIVIRFLVVAGAIVLMFNAFRTRRYAFAAVFGALALIYNPVAPLFGFSGARQFAVVLVSVVPFVASLAWRDVRGAYND